MITPALRVGGRESGAGSSYDNTPIVAGALRSNMRNNSDPATEARGLVSAPVSSKWSKGTGGPSGDEVQNLIADPISANEGKIYTHEGQNFRLHNAVAVGENGRGETLTGDVSRSISGGGGKPGQGYPAALTALGVRRLTPLECERLQGFPDGWTEGFSDSVRYKMLGNAVAVPVAEWIGRRMMLVEGVSNG